MIIELIYSEQGDGIVPYGADKGFSREFIETVIFDGYKLEELYPIFGGDFPALYKCGWKRRPDLDSSEYLTYSSFVFERIE